MKVTIYKDYGRATPLTEEVSFVKLTDMSVDSLTQSFSFLEDYKDSLLNGDVSQIICETNNEMYSWWRLYLRSYLDTWEYETVSAIGDIEISINTNERYNNVEILIKYNKEKNTFTPHYKGILDENYVWIPMEEESESLVGAIAYCLHVYGMSEKAYKKEFNPRKGLKMKEYNRFQKCLWDFYSVNMKSAEGYKNVSPEDIMIESIYSALKNTFNEKEIKELKAMLEDKE